MEEKTKEKFDLYDTIVSWACVIWAIASVALMVYFSGMNQVTFSIMTFGQLFVVVGIMLIVRRQLTYGSLSVVTGIACIIIPAINEWGNLFNPTVETDILLPIMLSTAITLLGIALMVGPGILERNSAKRCTETVVAEVIDIKQVELADKTQAYAPIYSYTYNDNVYTKTMEKYSKSNVPVVGSKIEVKVNPNKPEDLYIEASKASLMLIYIFGFSFFIAGAGMILTVLGSIY